MLIVLYISGHGLGHASRDVELIRAIRALRPDTRIVVRTSVPRWFFASIEGDVELQTLETDTGVVQYDSLSLDEDETARQAARFFAHFDRRVAVEAALIRGLGADAVVGDIPPLAAAAAQAAGVPSVMLGNFTWDWIYGAYDAFDRLAPDVIPAIERAYAAATSALRLPLHGGFAPMAAVTRDIPFIARRSARDREETRRTLGLPRDKPVVLPSFGGYGAALPLDRLRRSDRFTLLGPVKEPPAGLLYEDLVAAADVVVTKPGYGIVSECIANGAAMLYTSRGRFIEYDLFVEEMPRVLRCRYLTQEDLRAGRWDDAIDALLAQPPAPVQPPIDGAAVAARAVLALAGADSRAIG
jgi:hypothetical protein